MCNAFLRKFFKVAAICHMSYRSDEVGCFDDDDNDDDDGGGDDDDDGGGDHDDDDEYIGDSDERNCCRGY